MNTPTQKRAVNGLLSGLLFALLCISGAAYAQVSTIEMEPNDSAVDAQALCVPAEGISVTGSVGTGALQESTSDLDIYAFDASKDDTPSITVLVTDNMTTCSPYCVDTLLVLYDENGNILDQNDDAYPPNTGTTTYTDSRIDLHQVLADGRYYAAVTPLPRFLGDSFTPFDATVQGLGGNYLLTIANVKTPASSICNSTSGGGDPIPNDDGDEGEDDTGISTIAIEVLHWRDQDKDVSKHWKHKIKRMGKRHGVYPIPVVMFSSEHFDAATIDADSLRFGVSGEEESMFRCSRRAFDINRDGLKDKMCFFDAYKTGFDVGDVQGVLTGTANDVAFEATASLKVFTVSKDRKEKKAKHRNWRKGHRHHDHGNKHNHHRRTKWDRK